jgi:hypothetical protein
MVQQSKQTKALDFVGCGFVYAVCTIDDIISHAAGRKKGNGHTTVKRSPHSPHGMNSPTPRSPLLEIGVSSLDTARLVDADALTRLAAGTKSSSSKSSESTSCRKREFRVTEASKYTYLWYLGVIIIHLPLGRPRHRRPILLIQPIIIINRRPLPRFHRSRLRIPIGICTSVIVYSGTGMACDMTGSRGGFARFFTFCGTSGVAIVEGSCRLNAVFLNAQVHVSQERCARHWHLLVRMKSKHW